MQENRTKYTQKQRKKKMARWKKVALTLFLILILAGASYIFYLYSISKNAADKAFVDDGRSKSELRDKQVEPLKDNVSIMFIGVDDSEKRSQGSSNSRSDAIILATLNNEDKDVKMLSIPRDSYVYVPEFGYEDKITHAHTAPSGALSTIETVENLLNVPVDYYFELNFDAFIEIVDALGGIEVEVPYDLDEIDENDKRTIHLKAGVQTLNGSEALALARTRHYDNDFKRGERQQMILEAIIKKATSVTSITKYDELITIVGDHMTTNMPANDMASFFSYLSSGMPEMESLKLEGYDDTSTGTYYFKLNDDSVLNIRQTLQKHLEELVDISLNPADGTMSPDEVNLNSEEDATTETNSIEDPTTTETDATETPSTIEEPVEDSYTTEEDTTAPFTENSNNGQGYYSDNNNE